MIILNFFHFYSTVIYCNSLAVFRVLTSFHDFNTVEWHFGMIKFASKLRSHPSKTSDQTVTFWTPLFYIICSERHPPLPVHRHPDCITRKRPKFKNYCYPERVRKEGGCRTPMYRLQCTDSETQFFFVCKRTVCGQLPPFSRSSKLIHTPPILPRCLWWMAPNVIKAGYNSNYINF